MMLFDNIIGIPFIPPFYYFMLLTLFSKGSLTLFGHIFHYKVVYPILELLKWAKLLPAKRKDHHFSVINHLL